MGWEQCSLKDGSGGWVMRDPVAGCDTDDLASSSDSASQGEERCIYSDDEEVFDFEEMETGSVACIYIQLVCVASVVVWLTTWNN